MEVTGFLMTGRLSKLLPKPRVFALKTNSLSSVRFHIPISPLVAPLHAKMTLLFNCVSTGTAIVARESIGRT